MNPAQHCIKDLAGKHRQSDLQSPFVTSTTHSAYTNAFQRDTHQNWIPKLEKLTNSHNDPFLCLPALSSQTQKLN